MRRLSGQGATKKEYLSLVYLFFNIFLAVNPNHVSPGEVWTCCTKTEGHSAKTSGSAPDPLQTTPNRVPVEMARMTPPVSMLGGILHQLAKGKR
jgi:hypothetical protein